MIRNYPWSRTPTTTVVWHSVVNIVSKLQIFLYSLKQSVFMRLSLILTLSQHILLHREIGKISLWEFFCWKFRDMFQHTQGSRVVSPVLSKLLRLLLLSNHHCYRQPISSMSIPKTALFPMLCLSLMNVHWILIDNLLNFLLGRHRLYQWHKDGDFPFQLQTFSTSSHYWQPYISQTLFLVSLSKQIDNIPLSILLLKTNKWILQILEVSYLS